MIQSQQTQNSTSNTSAAKPQVTPTQEVRFALVMYGGVSLAIYINGVTQELFELVKATAQHDPDNPSSEARFSDTELTGSGRVYRKLGQLLGSKFSENGKQNWADIKPDTPISTRFVIDILSGTSAGGINAIFLAKALANGQSIEGIKDLWIKEGDIDKLINDQESLTYLKNLTLKQPPESLQKPPESLLNSERMYVKLIEALDSMEPLDSSLSALSQELDLYVTTTDIRGQKVPIKLSDMTVTERRHRNVFHFVFSGDNKRNDFEKENNPFLAFCARCTSSFPLAFEPMTLNDAKDTLRKLGRYQKEKFDSWKQNFFKSYAFVNCNKSGQDIARNDAPEQRAFGDGGYLDNKPFTYATDALLRHRSELPVHRKLIYIDPSPDNLKDSKNSEPKPNVLENGVAALLTLPRYETIREDIERIIERNRLIERVLTIIDDSKLERDIRCFEQQKGQSQIEPENGVEKWLEDMIRIKGISYGSYHRLKVSAVTDDLAKLLTSVAGFDEESSEFTAIRRLIRAWREQKYAESPENNDKQPENQFLKQFDFDYHIKRLYFLRRKVNEIYTLQDSARGILSHNESKDAYISQMANSPEETQKGEYELREELKNIKGTLVQCLKDLLDVRHCLHQATIAQKIFSDKDGCNKIYPAIDEFRGLVKNLGITPKKLREILNEIPNNSQQALTENKPNPTNAKQPTDTTQNLLSEKQNELQEVAKKLASIFADKFTEVEKRCHAALNYQDPSLLPPVRLARKCLRRYYDLYENYDMVTFPILYGTDVNEADQVDIIRISPEDATSLIDERKDSQNRRKLAGNAFFAFGGFLKAEWRKNDMMWGRLDGAERIISTLLPGKSPEKVKIREQLIQEAQQAIIAEEQLSDILTKGIDKYEVDRQLDPKPIGRYASRAMQVIGKILERVFQQQDLKVAPYLGRLVWPLVKIVVSRMIVALTKKYSDTQLQSKR